jgi:serine/threonine-protein kinase RsbW
MKPVTLTIDNDLESLVVLQSAVGTFVEAAGAESAVARQMELVVRELITNIIQFEYLPGQQEQIELDLACKSREIVLTIRFRGIPFDIEFLRRCEQVHLEEIASGEARWVGLHLVRHFCDGLQYQNLGKQGQQIVIRRRFSDEKPHDAPAASVESQDLPHKPVNVAVRRMLPREAAAVSRLVYIAYSYSYPHEHIYDPEQVRLLNETDQLISYVAINQDNNEIIGHAALVPDAASGLDEMAAAFVHPAYRGSGSLNALGAQLLKASGERQNRGVFCWAVASHPFSQKSAWKDGLREVALLISRAPAIVMTAIPGRKVERESVFVMVKLFGDTQRGGYYPPPRHREILNQICNNLGMTATCLEGPGLIDLPEQGALRQDVDHNQTGHISILAYGRDTLPQVRRILRGWCLDRLETIYIYVPLQQPGTSFLTASFEELGFFFSGLKLGQAGDDRLILQYLNNQRYDYSALKAGTTFGQQLIEYVRLCDPDGSG